MDKASWASWKLDLLDAMSKDPRVLHSDVVVAFRFLQHARDERRLIFPAQATVAAEIGMTERGVRNAIKRLRKYGWITIKKVPIAKTHGTRNLYTFHKPITGTAMPVIGDDENTDHRHGKVKITGTAMPPTSLRESPTYNANPPSGDSLAHTPASRKEVHEPENEVDESTDDDDAYLTPSFLIDLYEQRDGDLSAVASLPDGALEAEARLIERIREVGGAAYLIGLLAFLTSDLDRYEHVIATEMDEPGTGAMEGERLYAADAEPGTMRPRPPHSKKPARAPVLRHSVPVPIAITGNGYAERSPIYEATVVAMRYGLDEFASRLGISRDQSRVVLAHMLAGAAEAPPDAAEVRFDPPIYLDAAAIPTREPREWAQ